ncbi:MAG: glycosyltransferase [Pseudomonadota bacterium]
MPGLSCCIIVKDEAHNLPPLLESLAGLCDQIVVVDTGSSDGTPEMALRMGADVLSFPWTDSFSDARNESLRHARHPWLMYLDADDRLPEASIAAISKLKQNQPTLAHAFTIKSTLDGVSGMACVQIRMFPNIKGLRFRYRVHEQIRPSLMENHLPILPANVEIIHTGYVDRAAVAGKQRRNLNLLQRDLVLFPGDPFLHYLAGMAWLDLGEAIGARESFLNSWEFAFDRSDLKHIALGSALELADLAFEDKDTGVASEWLRKAETIDKEYPRCLYLRGRICLETGDEERGLDCLTMLLDCHNPDLLLPLDLNMLKARSAALAGQAYIKSGRPHEAVSVLSKAEELIARHPSRKI